MFVQSLPNSIFFEKPQAIKINEEAVTKYATSQKIEVLIGELKEKGPLIALSNICPGAYLEPPFKLKNKFCGKEIYGWKSGTPRKPFTNHLLILGAKKNNEEEHVYFSLSQDITLDPNSYIRVHKPSSTDCKIYIVSHTTFQNNLVDLYPQGTSREEEYAKMLTQLNLNSILDRGEVEKKCNEIGQKAFDEFKEKAKGNSFAGKEALQKICQLTAKAQDGHLRHQYISRAWDRIGDQNWQWQS